ncbi:MAG: hypothetical protein B0W54_15660 [Cellvibrio sp. 79]|nr:MAG: hypothetical protein B0W54_15660 [Cellvibrio sp. 79]
MKFSSVLMASAVLMTVITLSNTAIAKDGKVYTWTDSKGVIHYGEHPPKDVQAKLVKTRTGHSDPTPAPKTTTTNSSVSNVAEEAAPVAKDPKRCEQAKENQKLIDSGAMIRTKNAAGYTVYMSPEEKAKERERMQEIINQEC